MDEETEARECICGKWFTVVVKYARPWTVCPDCLTKTAPRQRRQKMRIRTTRRNRPAALTRVMSDGVLRFPCPRCDHILEVGCHVTDTPPAPSRESPSGVHYGHRVEFVAQAPHLHAALWGHLVRCHQPNPHPYMSQESTDG